MVFNKNKNNFWVYDERIPIFCSVRIHAHLVYIFCSYTPWDVWKYHFNYHKDWYYKNLLEDWSNAKPPWLWGENIYKIFKFSLVFLSVLMAFSHSLSLELKVSLKNFIFKRFGSLKELKVTLKNFIFKRMGSLKKFFLKKWIHPLTVLAMILKVWLDSQ